MRRNEWVVQRQLVGSQSTGLVGTEHVDTSKRLDGSKLLNNGLSPSEVGGTDGESCRGDDGQTDGYTDDEEDKGVNEQVVLGRTGNIDVSEETANPDDEDEEDDQDEQADYQYGAGYICELNSRLTDTTEDDLEVTFLVGSWKSAFDATKPVYTISQLT